MRPGSSSALPHLWGDEGSHYVELAPLPNLNGIPGVSRLLTRHHAGQEQYSAYHAGTSEASATEVMTAMLEASFTVRATVTDAMIC